MTMKKTVDNIVKDAINDLSKSMPNVTKAIIKNNYFISALVTDSAKRYILIDFTISAENVGYDNYEYYTKQLYFKFCKIDKWYEC